MCGGGGGSFRPGLFCDVHGRSPGKGDGRAERHAGCGIGASRERVHVAADYVEFGDGPAFGIQRAGLRDLYWHGAEWDVFLARQDGAANPMLAPRAAPARGGHVALAHPEAWRICQALKAAGVVPDFRAPDLIRLAPSPLFTRFAECAEAVERLRRIVSSGEHLGFSAQPARVTGPRQRDPCSIRQRVF